MGWIGKMEAAPHAPSEAPRLTKHSDCLLLEGLRVSEDVRKVQEPGQPLQQLQQRVLVTGTLALVFYAMYLVDKFWARRMWSNESAKMEDYYVALTERCNASADISQVTHDAFVATFHSAYLVFTGARVVVWAALMRGVVSVFENNIDYTLLSQIMRRIVLTRSRAQPRT